MLCSADFFARFNSVTNRSSKTPIIEKKSLSGGNKKINQTIAQLLPWLTLGHEDNKHLLEGILKTTRKNSTHLMFDS